jgi:hypothetical protein
LIQLFNEADWIVTNQIKSNLVSLCQNLQQQLLNLDLPFQQVFGDFQEFRVIFRHSLDFLFEIFFNLLFLLIGIKILNVWFNES